MCMEVAPQFHGEIRNHIGDCGDFTWNDIFIQELEIPFEEAESSGDAGTSRVLSSHVHMGLPWGYFLIFGDGQKTYGKNCDGDEKEEKSSNSQSNNSQNSNGCSSCRFEQPVMGSFQTNMASGGDGGDGDERKPFQKNTPSPKMDDAEGQNEEDAVPMDISDDLNILSSEKQLLSSDCPMPSAESLGVTYISDSGEVILKSKQYNIRNILGHGSFGVCALVVDYNQEKLFAMKQIKKEHFNADEVSIMRSLEGSPYIIQFYDLQDVQQNIRLFMEYAQGGDLQAFLASAGELSELDKVKFFQDIMLGVCYIHSKSIVHADIKSQNILLVSRNDGHYRAVLSDFGLSLRTTCPSYSAKKARGTVRYHSPELCRQMSCNTFSSDIWACGCVLVEIDTGSAPWAVAAEKGIPSLIFTIGIARQPPIPDGASGVLMKLYEGTLALQPEYRRTAREICFMLESLEYERHQK